MASVIQGIQVKRVGSIQLSELMSIQGDQLQNNYADQYYPYMQAINEKHTKNTDPI